MQRMPIIGDGDRVVLVPELGIRASPFNIDAPSVDVVVDLVEEQATRGRVKGVGAFGKTIDEAKSNSGIETRWVRIQLGCSKQAIGFDLTNLNGLGFEMARRQHIDVIMDERHMGTMEPSRLRGNLAERSLAERELFNARVLRQSLK